MNTYFFHRNIHKPSNSLTGKFPFVDADLKQSEEYLKLNPWGKVPAITYPNGFTLYESQAICKHLATKYSLPLLPAPSDIEASALFDQAACVLDAYFTEPSAKISIEKFVKPRLLQLPTDEAAVSEAVKSLGEFFDVQEHLLKKSGYMAGEQFSLVDIYYIPVILRLFTLGYEDLVRDRPAVGAWWDRCMDRPAVQAWIAAGKKATA
jgi:glutathione S-transferase